MTEYLHWFFGLPEIVRLICAGVTMLFGALVTAFGWVELVKTERFKDVDSIS